MDEEKGQEGEKILTMQQQHELKELHRKLRGSLFQLESTMTALDIPHKSLDTVPVR
jgi:hypothetical protein